MGGCGGLTVHSGCVAVRVSWSTTFLSFIINMIDLSMKAVHPWLHIKPTDSRAPDGNAGKMCAFIASSGRKGRSSPHVCDNRIVAPSDILTDNGDVFYVNMWGVNGNVISHHPRVCNRSYSICNEIALSHFFGGVI